VRGSWLLALLLAFPTCARAITLSTIRSDCRTLVKDTGASRQRFTNAQLLRFVNEGQKDLNQAARAVRKSTEWELAVGTTYYAAPSDFIFPLRITRDYFIIKEKSVSDLDKNSEWQKVAGLPFNYFIDFSSRTKIGFYPFPDDSSSTGTIRMTYLAQVSDLSADSDQPFNSITELQPYGWALSLYCAYRASLIDGQVSLATAYASEYKHELDMLQIDATSRPAYKPPVTGSPPP
jgi:hypothetical protein